MPAGLLAAGLVGADDADWQTAVARVWLIPTTSEGVGEDVRGTKALAFDAIIREGHTSELEITENPVETGVVVSDHAYMKPQRLELEGAVGDVWLYAKDQHGNAVDDAFKSDASRAAVAFAELLTLQRRAEPFSVQTGLRLYPNMVITSLSADQDAATAAILVFKASMREVIRVGTRTVTFPPRKPGKPKLQAAPTVAAGEGQSTPADPNACKGGLQSCGTPKLSTKSLADKLLVDAGVIAKGFTTLASGV